MLNIKFSKVLKFWISNCSFVSISGEFEFSSRKKNLLTNIFTLGHLWRSFDPRFVIRKVWKCRSLFFSLRHNFGHSVVPFPVAHFPVSCFDRSSALSELSFEILKFSRDLIFAIVSNCSLIQLFCDLKSFFITLL